MSQVACLLDELDGKPINPDDWRGYHPSIYSQSKARDDAMVRDLCARLQQVDVTKYSLEMQMWWRDHQLDDQARIEADLRMAKDEVERKAALEKLTPHERKLLGLK